MNGKIQYAEKDPVEYASRTLKDFKRMQHYRGVYDDFFSITTFVKKKIKTLWCSFSTGTLYVHKSKQKFPKKDRKKTSFLCTGDPYYVLYTVLLIS